MRIRRLADVLLLAMLGAAAPVLSTCGRKTPVKPPELVAPEPIDNLKATNTAGGVRLTWRRPTEYADGTRMSDLGAFRIERSANGAPFTTLATITLSDQQRFQQERRFRWTDADAAVGETYQYRVISLTTDGYVSEASNLVTIERAVPTPAPTPAPTPR